MRVSFHWMVSLINDKPFVTYYNIKIILMYQQFQFECFQWLKISELMKWFPNEWKIAPHSQCLQITFKSTDLTLLTTLWQAHAQRLIKDVLRIRHTWRGKKSQFRWTKKKSWFQVIDPYFFVCLNFCYVVSNLLIKRVSLCLLYTFYFNSIN